MTTWRIETSTHTLSRSPERYYQQTKAVVGTTEKTTALQRLCPVRDFCRACEPAPDGSW
jgi:hypothetical protein